MERDSLGLLVGWLSSWRLIESIYPASHPGRKESESERKWRKEQRAVCMYVGKVRMYVRYGSRTGAPLFSFFIFPFSLFLFLLLFLGSISFFLFFLHSLFVLFYFTLCYVMLSCVMLLYSVLSLCYGILFGMSVVANVKMCLKVCESVCVVVCIALYCFDANVV